MFLQIFQVIRIRKNENGLLKTFKTPLLALYLETNTHDNVTAKFKRITSLQKEMSSHFDYPLDPPTSVCLITWGQRHSRRLNTSLMWPPKYNALC